MSATNATQPVPPTFWSSVRLVAGREITSRLRSKAFLATTGLLLAVVAVLVVLPGVLGDDDDPVPVAVVGQGPDLAAMERPDGTPYFEVVHEGSLEEAKAMLSEETAEAAVVFGDCTTWPDCPDGGVTVWGYDSPPTEVVQAFSTAPPVELVDPDAPDEQTLYFVSVIFALAFFMAAMTFGTQIATSVVEEKQTRIVEILLSAVSARALLTGKILGNAALAFGQVVLVAAVAIGGLAAAGGGELGLSGLGPAIAWYVPLFAVGFLMLASMFAAAGAMVSRSEDIGSVTMPITMLVMVPYLLMFFVNGDELWSRVLSWVPFSAPIAMPVQVYAERALWWEPIGALLVLLLTTAVIVRLAERVYTRSLLRTGTRVKLAEALR